MSTSAFGRGRSNASGGGEPPRLETLSDEPVYDISTVVQELSVRVPVLWAWEQQLGLSTQPRDGGSSQPLARRYSERELIALKWIRDQVLAGVSLREASARLLASQRLSSRNSGVSHPVSAPPTNFGSSLGQAVAPRQPNLTRPLQQTQDPWAVSGRVPAVTRRLAETDLIAARQSLPGSEAMVSGVWHGPNASPAGRPFPERIPPQAAQRSERDISALVQPMLRAFARFDTVLANQVLEESLAQHPVETVCLRLLQPALSRVGDLWAHHEMTIPEEHFAVNYARGFLFSVFHATREAANGPLVYVACGPRETHDIGALTLALFWRRAGMRVVYLGQDAEGSSLVQSVLARRPALVAISITTPQRVRSLARLVKDIDQVPSPKPFVTYGGIVFVRNPELQRKVPGVYLGDDAGMATWHVRRLLQLDHKPPR